MGNCCGKEKSVERASLLGNENAHVPQTIK